MAVSIAEAAHQLGVDRSRVEQLVRSGALPARRSGRMWLIDEAAVADRRRHPHLPGRPMAPGRAWALLDLLDGGPAPWLSPVGRSQVKAQIARMQRGDAEVWRRALRARSDVARVLVHPSVVGKAREHPRVIVAGAAQASRAGADLVAVGAVPELYLPAADWAALARQWQARLVGSGENLVVRVPRGLWPFGERKSLGLAVLAADLLESAEPRAIRAGLLVMRRQAEAIA